MRQLQGLINRVLVHFIPKCDRNFQGYTLRTVQFAIVRQEFICTDYARQNELTAIHRGELSKNKFSARRRGDKTAVKGIERKIARAQEHLGACNYCRLNHLAVEDGGAQWRLERPLVSFIHSYQFSKVFAGHHLSIA